LSRYNETVGDLHRKYGDTFIKYKGQVIFCREFLAGGRADKHKIYMHYSEIDTGQGVGPVEVQHGSDDFEEIELSSGLYNTDVLSPVWQAYTFSRSPRVQWRRGLCNGNVAITSLTTILYPSFQALVGYVRLSLDGTVIRQIVNPKYYSYEEAYKGCKSKEFMAVALSKHLGMCVSPIDEGDPCLYLSNNSFIGRAHPKEIVVKHETALQEVHDYLQRTKTSIAVGLQ